jgi:hypothetical protein
MRLPRPLATTRDHQPPGFPVPVAWLPVLPGPPTRFTPAPSVTVQQRPAPALPVPAPPLVRTVSPRPKHRYRGGTPTPPSCYMLEWHPTSKISPMTFFSRKKPGQKIPPPAWTRPKISHPKIRPGDMAFREQFRGFSGEP